MAKVLCQLMLCAVIAACQQTAVNPDDLSLEQRLAAIDALTERWQRRGASGIVHIGLRGRTLYQRGFGSAHCEQNEAIDARTHFLIGSITKEFTQLLGHILQERGFLSFADSVQQYFPSLTGPIGALSISLLIDHRAGLADLIDNQGNAIPYRVEYDYVAVTRAQLIERIGRSELLFPPGTDERYSNLGYQLLAAIYEQATGLSYEALLRRYIYEPAGLFNTGYWFTDAEGRAFADGCRRGDRHWGNPIDDQMWDAGGASWNLKGAGGIIATAPDLTRFFEGIGAGIFFRSADASDAYKRSRLVDSEYRQQAMMGPAGSNGIFNAVGLWLDRDRFSIVMITNRAEFQAESNMVQELIRLFPPGSLPQAD